MPNPLAAELAQHIIDTHAPLPHSADYIHLAELGGLIIDLHTGAEFDQRDDWLDFTRTWIAERTRRGHRPTWNRLAVAISRAAAGDLPIATAITLAQFCLNCHNCHEADHP